MITCPRCGKQNRATAKFCSHCGADLSPTRAILPAVSGENEPPRRVSGLMTTLKRWVDPGPPLSPTHPRRDVPTEAAEQAAPQGTGSLAVPSTHLPPALPQTADRLTPLPRGSVISHPLDPRRKYTVLTARELPRSVYYDALDLVCLACGSLQQQSLPDGTCRQCHSPLQPVLIHERRPRSNGQLTETEVEGLIRLSAGHPHILSHQAIIQYQENVYTVVEHPGRWGVVVRGRQQSPGEAVASAVQIGRTLLYLHDRGFAHSEVGGASIESLVTIVGGADGGVKIADLSTCVRLQADDAQALRAQINSDTAFLAWLLFYLSTGKELSRASIELAPAVLQPFIERAMQRQYASIEDMLADLSSLPATPPAIDRPLKPSHGQATHPGKKHDRNEDAIVTFTFDKQQEGESVPVGFYLVADGMGGHDAGDLASRTVNQTVTDWIIQVKVLPDLGKATRWLRVEDVPGELLSRAIKEANEMLLSHGKAHDSDLGSTVTAVLIIGDVATIANVGDSRTYLLRQGRLEQITQDHSLVARLVDAGVIGPQEARKHPQRSHIYRCLGHEEDVEVDVFTRQLQAGDALVLCSDGLWEMVPDVEIQRMVESARSPQKACDALVEAANRAGGEDNIAVIVVEIE